MSTPKDPLKSKLETHLDTHSQNISEKDLKRVIDNEDKIEERLNKKSPLNRFLTDIQLFTGLVKDYYYGNYRKIPYKSIASVVTALLYIINPIDIIPDFIPLIGQIDDALVFGMCVKLIEKDLEEYRHWKKSNRQPS